MATTARIASQTLTTGQYVDGVVFSTAGVGVVTIQLIAAQVGAVLSQARALVFDSDSGNKLASIVIDGSDTKTIEIAPAPLNCRVSMECLAGSAAVAVNQLTGGDQEDFVAGAFDAAFCASVFANGAIGGVKLATGPFSLDSVLANPVNGANQAAIASGTWPLVCVGGGENRGLPIPTIAGQVMLIVHTGGANTTTVTSAQALDAEGTTVLNFTAAFGQWVLLIAENNGAALRWKVNSQGGGVANSIPVYVPLTIADPGNAGTVNVLGQNGTCAFNFAGAAETRVLSNPLFEGQTVTLRHTAGANAAVLTVTNGFNAAGATAVNFPAALDYSVAFIGVVVGAALRWRELVDNSALSHLTSLVADPGNGNAIPVTYDNGVCFLNILAGGHNRSLAAPTYEGQKLTLVHNAGAFAGTVTVTNGFCTGGATILNFVSTATEQQSITLIGITQAAGLRWRVLHDENRIKPSQEITDPGNGNAIVVTYDKAVCRLNIAGGGHNRSLADPTYEGQVLEIIHNAGANAGTVTCASDCTDTGAQNVINFTATLTEWIALTSVGTVWRVTSNPDALVIN